jgi:asparagine synthase (glutamine-hydrolysing)
MCGIAGFSGSDNHAVLKGMNRTLFHRGPDDEGYFSDGLMNLAMRRLSIVDIESGKQPMSNEDGSIWVVFNGEIYNHEKLRRGLERGGHQFRTNHSDTEVIPHLYEEHGESWVSQINGMFGIALWDRKKQRLLLYRDRIGKKPLYYSVINREIIFGSEIKAVLKHPLVSRNLDYAALYHYFTLKNISAPRTAFSEIRQLLPGHILVWEGGKVEIKSYWQVYFGDPIEDISEEEAAQHLFELFEDAVHIRMQCDAPYGAYLSGGVDSSSVVAMMTRHQRKPVKTFCLGYEDEPEGQFIGKAQDLAYASEMSKRLGTDHHEYIISAKQFADQMSEVVSAFDEPFSGVVSTFFLSILIRRHVKVALSGDGADELFGSYLAHRLAFPIEAFLKQRRKGILGWNELAESDKLDIAPFNSSEQYRFLETVASGAMDEWRNRLTVFNREEKEQLLSREFLNLAGEARGEDLFRNLALRLTAKDVLNRSLEINQNELLPNQVLPFVDRLSMAHSVEVRVPYLDYRIIEFANSLPGKFKIRNGIVKYIHKKTMEKLLPEAFLKRPKEGFVQPIYSWMRTRLNRWVRESLDTLPPEVFNLEYVGTLLNRYDRGEEGQNAKIWNLICFGIWYNSLSMH